MVPIMSLVLPILLSSVIVFVASFLIHMVLPYHRSDMRQAPKEDELLAALRSFNIPAGTYGVPHPGTMAGMKSPAFIEKMKAGPIVLMTVSPGASPSMAPSLAMWFGYLVVVGIFAAYIAGRALGPGADYLQVFRFAGCTAFTAYSLALVQNSIWYKRSWSTTCKDVLDGLVYGLLTGGTFGWLWPR
jgi:hypothetical protein